MPLIEVLADGEIIADRYRIERMIGAGGMSRVYLVSDLKLPGKAWAMKVVAAAAHFNISLEEEAALLIALDHPRLPRIIDISRPSETGHLYMIMDYVEGEHLDRYAERQGSDLTLPSLISIGQQICEGLQYLHSHEPPIIHRDLKPANLLVDQHGEIRFIDFGIARRYKEDQAEDTVLIGSAGFAAPEQYGGRQSDCRTDLYSLGAVLLYLGTGGAHSVWSEEAASVIRRNGYARLLPVLQRLLQAEPQDRYPSAIETSRALSLIAGRREYEQAGRPQRCSVIAVLGASPGIGVTHTTIMIAHALTRYSKRVAVVEMEAGAAAFTQLAQAVTGRAKSRADHASVPRRFRIHAVDYVRHPSRAEWIELLAEGYEFVICDLGSTGRKELIEEFSRADLPILVVSGAEWREEEAVSFGLRVGEAIRRKLVCFIPLGGRGAQRRLRKHLGTDRVYEIAEESDPFEPGQAMVGELMKICYPEAVKSSRVEVTGFGFRRKRWKGSGN
ncbi:serine/threonine protein kinase [Paenibacillus woosongensis]|uniref:serine/threonine protein kinase n=1 Tax=Paenibacillus woosongensis TaxID=307580 RepID=UPI0018C2EF8F|nr:serine/threonine-protein kinase [Paenibacillus woosongensis]